MHSEPELEANEADPPNPAIHRYGEPESAVIAKPKPTRKRSPAYKSPSPPSSPPKSPLKDSIPASDSLQKNSLYVFRYRDVNVREPKEHASFLLLDESGQRSYVDEGPVIATVLSGGAEAQLVSLLSRSQPEPPGELISIDTSTHVPISSLAIDAVYATLANLVHTVLKPYTAPEANGPGEENEALLLQECASRVARRFAVECAQKNEAPTDANYAVLQADADGYPGD
ncbi:hypothetical protein EIP91_007731 [Steccherinum ochraceum]|uniref:Uncharacterized protein n=1 Tax=Steccherinum ochraceum TaxID=92696 RepID=A0A4R0S0L1_9APHY|nr:hypothetical protein EIP91_007731 [Steccherinum ochraceum]